MHYLLTKLWAETSPGIIVGVMNMQDRPRRAKSDVLSHGSAFAKRGYHLHFKHRCDLSLSSSPYTKYFISKGGNPSSIEDFRSAYPQHTMPLPHFRSDKFWNCPSMDGRDGSLLNVLEQLKPLTAVEPARVCSGMKVTDLPNDILTSLPHYLDRLDDWYATVRTCRRL